MTRTTTAALAIMLAFAAGSAGAQDITKTYAAPVRIRYMVHDVTVSAAFYTGQLGFKLDGQSGPYFAALSRGPFQLLLSPTTGPGGASQPMPNGDRPVPGGWARLVINVTDISGEVDRLRKAGVHFRNDIVTGLDGKEIVFDDPSGNPVELFQPS